MDSPAKGDIRQGPKASQKHIEFQLQREKAYSRELEEKLKVQQAHIAKLDQDKAELRRELITLTDDDKKKTKLEEKCHALQKELADKQAALIAEQKRVTTAECEKEQIRRDAHVSIAKWCEAEKQWIAENETIQKELDESKEIYTKLKSEYEALVKTCDDMSRQLQCEKEHRLRLELSAEAGEKKITSLHARIEALQNDVYTRDETVFKLDEAGAKWQEICHSKDDEIKALEMQNIKMSDTVEKLQNTISTLNQRIEASKLLNVEEKGRFEKVSCDLRESEKQKKLVQMELDALRRDFEHVSQNASKHQELMTELRSKLVSSTEQLKEKAFEIRRLEFTISQLTADLKQVEREMTDNNHLLNAHENQIQKLRDALEEAELAAKRAQDEKTLLEAELQQVKASHEARDETVVLMKSELEDKIEGLLVDIKRLESEVNERQKMINNVMNQLDNANSKNEELYDGVLRESNATAQLRVLLEELQMERNKICLEQLFREEKICRLELQEQCLENISNIFIQHSSTTSIVLIQCLQEACRLDDTVRVLDAEKAATINQLEVMRTDFEEKLRVLGEHGISQAGEIGAKNMEIACLQEKIKECEGSLMLLREELQLQQKQSQEFRNTEKALSDRLVEVEHFFQQMSATSEKQACSLHCAVRQLDESTHLLMIYCENYIMWISEKMEIFLSEFNNIYTRETGMFLDALSILKKAHREAEERCAHLQLDLRDTGVRLKEQDEMLATQSEKFLMKVSLADSQREMAEKAKDDLLKKYTALTEQLQANSNLKNGKIKELQVQLNTEKHNNQLIEAKLQKLRKKMDYELGRKNDYKKALEEVKLKREEAERYRATEKNWAVKAINRANEEVDYWVRSFEKLKSMLDDLSNRSGARVSAVDQAVIQKFEEARNRLTLRDHEVNTTSREEGDGHREKRVRTQ